MTQNLYIVTNAQNLALANVKSQTSYTIPQRMQDITLGDILLLNVYLADGAGGYDSASGATGYILKIGVGLPGNHPAAALQTTWAQIANGWSGSLALNTTGLSTLLGTAQSMAAVFEVQLIDPSGNQRTIAQLPVTLRNDVIDIGSLVAPPTVSDANIQSLGSTSARALSARFAEVINVKDYGAKGNAQSVTDAAISAGFAVLVSATAGFVAGDVGKAVSIAGAGPSGGALTTTILVYNSSTQVTVAANATGTVSGANCTWGTDDTTAINAAITALAVSGGELFFPPGVYRTTSALALPVTGVRWHMRGSGKHSRILHSGAGDCLTVSHASGSVQELHCKISEISIEGAPGITSTSRGIFIRNIYSLSLDSVLVKSFTLGGIHIDAASTGGSDWTALVRLHKCISVSNGGYGLKFGGTSNNLHAFSVTDSRFDTNATYGIWVVANGSGLKISGCCAEYNTTANILWGGIMSGAEITGCYFEGSAKHIVFSSGASASFFCDGLSICGNTFQAVSTTVGIEFGGASTENYRGFIVSGNFINGFTTGVNFIGKTIDCFFAGNTFAGCTNRYAARIAGDTSTILDQGSFISGINIGSASQINVDNAGTVSIATGSNGTRLFNTSDQTTNYERGSTRFNSNLFQLIFENAGTAVARTLELKNQRADGTNVTFDISVSTLPFISATRSVGTSGTGNQIQFSFGSTASSGTTAILALTPTIAQSSTAGYTGLLVNVTESSLGSGAKLLADLQIAGTSKLSVDNGGLINTQGNFQRAGTQLLTTRQTGYTAATGTATRTTFVTGSVTLSVLAEHVKAIIDDLMTHGIIGA